MRTNKTPFTHTSTAILQDHFETKWELLENSGKIFQTHLDPTSYIGSSSTP